ncbi:MAG: hypothetical protein GDA38_03420 [Hormoscilla sp. SP12CHS1]|nr:hypothetical protein [Hormoscilla sp. SP12CHS1]
MSKIKFLYALPIVLAVTSGVTLDKTSSDNSGSLVSTNLEAYAKSRGGRSRGGSFRRSSPPSRSGSRSSGSGSSGSDYYRNDDSDYYPTSPIYRRRRYYSYSTRWELFWLYLFIFVAGILGLILFIYLFQWFVNRPKSSVPKELANDIVTVSKLQVAGECKRGAVRNLGTDPQCRFI